MRAAYAFLLAALLVAGCASSNGGESFLGVAGDVELVGTGTMSFPGADPTAPQNFDWKYETEAWRDVREAVFHRMRTELKLAFDPATGVVSNVTVACSGHGGAFRHVCLTPGPEGSGLLTIRMTTLLDDRDQDMTVVKVHSTDPSTHMCEEYGVGPKDGLVEGVSVLFKDDGTFKVLPDTGAYLAGHALGMERRMTVDPGMEEIDTDVLP
jgi:hypothetical protein